MPDAFNAELLRLRAEIMAKPRDSSVRRQIAAVYLDVGDPADAEDENRIAIALGAPRDAVLPALGAALVVQGEFQKALNEIEFATDKESPALLCLRANALIGMNNLDGARNALEAALQKQKDFPDALIGLARVAYLAHDEEAARRYAELALATAPKHIEALQFQGDLLGSRNASAESVAVYDKLLSINPRYLPAHLGKAYQHIATGAFSAAEADINAARLVNPRSALLFYAQALLDYGQGKQTEAREEITKVLRGAPDHMPSLLLAGSINLALGSNFQAQHYLQRFIDKNPDHVYARKMLALALLRTKRAEDAQAILEPAMKKSDADLELYTLAGESYMRVRNFTQAQNVFERAANLKPTSADLRSALGLSKLGAGDKTGAVDDMRNAAKLEPASPRASITLIRTMLALGQIDEAAQTAAALAQRHTHNVVVLDLLGQAYLRKGNLRQARTGFENALTVEPAYFPALRHLVDVDLQERAPAAAHDRVLAYLKKNNASVDALQLLAGLANGAGKPAEATQWMEQASAEHPTEKAVSMALLAQYAGTGANQKALDLASKLLVSAPTDPEVLDSLGKVQLAMHEDEKALVSFKQVALRLPRSAQAKMQVAAVQLRLNRIDDAKESLKEALIIQPDLPAAKLILAEMYIQHGWYEMAQPIAESLQKTYPQETAGYQLEGDVLMGQHQPAKAAAVYKRALSMRPTSKLAVKTVRALRADGKLAEGTALLARWLREYPSDSWAALYLAEIQTTDNQHQSAAATLAAVVAREPKNIVALNNLALTYQRMHDARAQAPAESAYVLAGNQPAIMDTLGWILVEGDNTARGVSLLKKAVAQSPDACAIRFHLAKGLLKVGDTAGARQELLAVVGARKVCPEKDDAQALLAQ